MSNKLSQFWQELKRRKVIRVISVYAASAFVILELVGILSPSLRLPEWAMNFILVILIIGFIISIVLSWFYDIHPEGGMVKTRPVKKLKPEDIPKSSHGWMISTYISLVIIAGLIALNLFRDKNEVINNDILIKSIAVLPFHNYTGDQNQDPMCFGLTNEVISHLFKVKSFDEVRSHTSVLPYRDSEQGATEIANALKVNYILEGSLKRINDKYRVTAQLIEPQSDQPVWVKDYDMEYSQVVGIPAEIALNIAEHLKAFISMDEQERIERIPTFNGQAYRLIQEYGSVNPYGYQAESPEMHNL